MFYSLAIERGVEKCRMLSTVVGRYSLDSGSINPETLNMQDTPRQSERYKIGLKSVLLANYRSGGRERFETSNVKHVNR